MPLPLRIAHGTMAALFALSVVLQFNDPSPWAWGVFYALAAGAALLAAINRFSCARIFGAIVLVVGVVAEIPYVRAKAWATPFADLTKEWHMTSPAIVDGREFYALLWIVGWMIVVVVTSHRAVKSAPPSS